MGRVALPTPPQAKKVAQADHLALQAQALVPAASAAPALSATRMARVDGGYVPGKAAFQGCSIGHAIIGSKPDHRSAAYFKQRAHLGDSSSGSCPRAHSANSSRAGASSDHSHCSQVLSK